MEYITLCLDSTNEVEQWYVRYNYFMVWYNTIKYLCLTYHCFTSVVFSYIVPKFRDFAEFYYILITNLMHWLLFIHKILFSSTCFEPQVLILRTIQLYTCNIWHCHSCVYVAFVLGWWALTTPAQRQHNHRSDSTICCTCTTVSSWGWALEARNM